MLAVLQFPRSELPLWPFFPAEQATLKLGLLLGADAPPQIGQVHRLRQLGTPGKPSKYQLFGVWPAALRAKHMYVWAALPPGWGRIWCCEQVRHAGLGLAHWSRAAAQAWWLGVCADFCRRQVHNGLELDRGTTSGWAEGAEGSVVAGQLLFSELALAALQFASAWLCTD